MSDVKPSPVNEGDVKPADTECMTAAELARWLRVNRKTVYEYADRKVIPCRRLGRRLVFSRQAVTAWLACSSVMAESVRS